MLRAPVLFRFGELVSIPPDLRRAPPTTESFAPELAADLKAKVDGFAPIGAREAGVESAAEGVDDPAVARLLNSLVAEVEDEAGMIEVFDLEVAGVKGRTDLVLAAPREGVLLPSDGILEVETLLDENTD